jgi:hypothetical protein
MNDPMLPLPCLSPAGGKPVVVKFDGRLAVVGWRHSAVARGRTTGADTLRRASATHGDACALQNTTYCNNLILTETVI